MWCSVMTPSRRDGHPAGASLRRRAHRAQGSRGDRRSAASKAGLYSNLITAAVTLNRARLEELAKRGLDHVQISFQDVDAENAERIGAYPGATQKKLDVAKWVTELGLPLTINAPIHRQNIHNVGRYIELAVKLGAQRLEIAHVQYYGWAFLNRAALIPTYDGHARLDRARRARARAAERRAHHRHGGAGLLRQAPEALHGRLGQRLHEHHAGRQGAALPRRRDHQGAEVRQRPGAEAARHLAQLAMRSTPSAARIG